MIIRIYQAADLENVLSCFDRSVREIGARYYTPRQVEAWATASSDPAGWRKRLETGGVFLAEIDERLAGFARIEESGYVDLLFVSPQFERRGIGGKLLQAANTWAREKGAAQLWSDVSLAARPLFESMGFKVVEAQIVERCGERLKNYRMVL